MLLARLALLFLLVAAPAAAQIRDLVRPQAVAAGETREVDAADLFFHHDDLPVFGAHADLAVSLGEDGTVRITPRDGFEGLALVPFTWRGGDYVLPVRSFVRQQHTFRFPAGDARPADVHVIGGFNDWSRMRDRLTDPDGDGVYEVTLALDAGRYEYKFTVDGEEVMDPTNPVTVPNPFGAFNNILVVAPRHTGRLALHMKPWDGESLHFTVEADDPAPVEWVVLLDNRALPPAHLDADGRDLAVRLAGLDLSGSRAVRVAALQNGRATRFTTVRLHDGLPAGDGPFTWHDAVLYQIMVDRFHDGDPSNTRPLAHDSLHAIANYHGGDLQGILDKLEEGYFERLGVNVLWLSPVVQNTDRAHREYPPPHRYYTGYHGYWPTHPTEVEERFGDMALLQELIRTAQGRGMRVLLDYVANHTHEDHPFFRQHRDWFGVLELPNGRKNLRIWDEYRLTTWFEPYLPSFDFEGSPEALEVMTDNAVWWLIETGADGFRHDAVKHIPNSFWRTLTAKIRRQVDPARGLPVYQIGETFGSYDLISSYVTPGQLDAQFNFNLYDAALYTFLDPGASFAVLDGEMQKSFDVYGTDHLMGNLMDSHDKPRFAAFADGDLLLSGEIDASTLGWTNPPVVENPQTYDRLALYLAYMLTTPGVPTIYYGDEIGMTGANDPDNRRPMRFGRDVTDDERALKHRTASLVNLRNSRPALRHGDFHTLRADESVYAFLRSDPAGRVLVLLNKSTEPITVSLDLPAAAHRQFAVDAFDDAPVPMDAGRLALDVPAMGYRVVDVR
jgi:cyclomaltodextrinase / maltogenic alpha-amylase / neopullulanase